MKRYEEIFNARGHLYNEATSICPGARESERQAVIARLNLPPAARIIDAPAGGGYLADGILRYFVEQNSVEQNSVERIAVTCVEPAANFSSVISPEHITVTAALHDTGLPECSFDAIASLAGLHHVTDRDRVYRHWRGLLVPGGQLVVADVQESTGTGDFLNGYVDEHTPGGHEGLFFEIGELTARLSENRFEVIEDQLVDVPWRFAKREEMGEFCRKLFAMESVTSASVADHLESIVGTKTLEDGGLHLLWQLRIATALVKT